MADSSAIQSIDESQLLEAVLERPFEPADVPLSPAVPSTSTSLPTSDPTPVPPPTATSPPSTESVTDADITTWQATYDAQVTEWRSQSASARSQAELTRAKWEAIREREEAERKAREQSQAEPQSQESWSELGDHITTGTTAASQVVASSLSASVASLESIEHVEDVKHEEVKEEQEESEERESGEQEIQHVKAESGSPEQRWEHIPSSPTSSYPSMSFPEASAPQSPSPQRALLVPITPSAEPHQNPPTQPNPTRTAPSTIPAIMDNRVAPRTRTSLILSSLAINLLLPFINGVMLGFGEIFAKDVVLGWFGWKSHSGRTAANVGLRN